MSGTGPATGTAASVALEGLPTSVAGREVMAGDYVIGLLDTRHAQRVRAATQVDPAWRDAVAAWETRLAPLVAIVRPETPPGNIWDRIEARVAPAEAPRVRKERRSYHIWRIVAGLAVVGMLGTAGYMFYARRATERLMAVLANDRNLPGVLLERDRRGDLTFINLPAASGRVLQAPSGKVLQIWAVAPGAQAPTNLGVLPYEPVRQLTIPARLFTPEPEMLIQITVEAEGGSTTGRPIGPTIFVGRLANVAAAR